MVAITCIPQLLSVYFIFHTDRVCPCARFSEKRHHHALRRPRRTLADQRVFRLRTEDLAPLCEEESTYPSGDRFSGEIVDENQRGRIPTRIGQQ